MKPWLKTAIGALIIHIFVTLVIITVTFFPLEMREDAVPGTIHFTEVAFPFEHGYDNEVFPFLGGALIDVDGDGREEIFVGGGRGQSDAFYSYDGRASAGTFSDIIEGTGLSSDEATYGVLSLDIDADGRVDLITARHDGVSLYMNGGGTFERRQIPLDLEEDSVPYSVAAGDVNNDGFVDLYVSTFVDVPQFMSATFNDAQHGKRNVFLVNNGDNTFTERTVEAGVLVDQNTFLSLFVDLDGDGWQDLVVSPNTDRVRLFRNDGDGSFTEMESPTGYGFWMGLTAGDVDNDGDMDLFLTNAGRIAPEFLLRGDLRDDQVFDGEWVLLENQGNFSFTAVRGFPPEFAWGAVMEDVDLDGRLDVLVAENYVKWFAHNVRKYPGRLLMQSSAGAFVPVTQQAGLENREFAQSPLVTDLNDDGFPDIILLNMVGPSRAFVNDGNDNTWIKVVVPDALDFVGARVTVTSGGQQVTREFLPGQGYMTDQSAHLFFGIEADRANVTVRLRSGRVVSFTDVLANSVVDAASR